MTVAFAVIAKAPRVGEVKTRLVPPLSAEDAAALGAAFMEDVAGNILAAAQTEAIAGYVAFAPADTAPLFRDLLPASIRLLPSRRAGLAASLFDATEDLLAAGHDAVCLVNADSPNLPTGFLVQAARALAQPGDRIVLGPAEDGGYYLIGLKHAHRRLFEEIAWSTERVFGQTLDRAAELRLETVILPPWYDVDDAASLRRLHRELLGGAGKPEHYAAPRSTVLLGCIFGAEAGPASGGL